MLKDYYRKIFTSLAAGIGGGILMAVILLYMMIATVFTTNGMPFFLEAAVAMAFPLCLNLFDQKEIMRKTAQFLMISVSFAITQYYAGYASPTADFPNMNAAIYLCSAILHGLSLLAFAVSAIYSRIQKRRREKGQI